MMKTRVAVISDYIVSPLGFGSLENFNAVLSQHSKISLQENIAGLKEPAMASMLDRDIVEAEVQKEGIPTELTFFEKILILSIKRALENTNIDPTSERTGIVISSTKGNVSLLDERSPMPASVKGVEGSEDRITRSLLGTSAQIVAKFFGNPNTPVVVSNACISGVCAEVLAYRQILDGTFDNVIVCGADVQGLFIMSGFQSFKALSLSPCKPFDKDRDGLNLGEASAAMILSAAPCFSRDLGWSLVSGAIRNDANHISGPSRTGEGSYRALMATLNGINKDEIAFVNVHGTSTPYNDEMESIALGRAGLNEFPINALKGNYGHTMGAAGIVESIISMRAVERGIVLPTKGFENIGVSVPVAVSAESRKTEKKSFVKLLSGFGGCNAAALFSMDMKEPLNVELQKPLVKTVHTVEITPDSITVDAVALPSEGQGKALLDNAYRKYVGDYPKYFKMDTHCKAGFVASELLLKDDPERFNPRSDRSVVLMGSTSSLCNDIHYQETIQSEDNYYPSPSLFVYTLANIITGEISIRNKYLGETSFYVLPSKDKSMMERFLNETFMDKEINSAIFGWIDCFSDDDFSVSLSLVQRQDI